jgi:hypothetical protein
VTKRSGRTATCLSRLDDRFSSTTFYLRLNLWGIGIWLVQLLPTILFSQESVPYVVFMSWYANFVGHISAYIVATAVHGAGWSDEPIADDDEP